MNKSKRRYPKLWFKCYWELIMTSVFIFLNIAFPELKFFYYLRCFAVGYLLAIANSSARSKYLQKKLLKIEKENYIIRKQKDIVVEYDF